jgi:leader peptidase (prepilin peptidase)/N-methyltransferase
MEIFYQFLERCGLALKLHPLGAWSLIVLLALLAASVMSALYLRLPAGRKFFLFSYSECPYCKTILKWRDVIPLASFFLARGKCRYCEAPLPRGLWVMEWGTFVIICLSFALYGPSIPFTVYTYFFLSLFLVAAIDLTNGVIPDEITLKGIALGMFAAFLFPSLMQAELPQQAVFQAALGFLTGVFLIGTIRFLGDLVIRQETLGLGDVMLMGMVGTFLGPRLVTVAFFLAPLLALPVALNFWIGERKAFISYGPFIALSAVLALYFGDTIVDKFQSLLR